MVLTSHGQVPTESQAMHPGGNLPELRILDKSKFLRRDDDVRQRISSQIRTLEQDHGFRIYLVIEPSFIGSTVQEKANELRRLWIPDGDGLVVVFESDSRNLGFGQDMAGDPGQLENPNRVPPHETTAILSRAIGAVDDTPGPEIHLERIMGKIVTGFDSYFLRRETPPPMARSVRTALLMVGGLSLLGLMLIGAGGLIRHSGMTRGRRFRFPVVDRPERLGAPCGSSVTARRFAPPANGG